MDAKVPTQTIETCIYLANNNKSLTYETFFKFISEIHLEYCRRF